MTTSVQSLLPANANDFERYIENATASRLDGLNVTIKSLWNPDTCPEELLSVLAWSLSVDSWNNNWTEDQKRTAVKKSWKIHAKKGTIGAMSDALDVLGYDLTVIEWFDEGGEPGTFRIEVEVKVDSKGLTINDALFDEIQSVALEAKNERSHLTNVRAISTAEIPYFINSNITVGDTISIMPYLPEDSTHEAPFHTGMTVYMNDSITIKPSWQQWNTWGET